MAERALTIDSDYRVRKAAVLALADLGGSTAAEILSRVVESEPHFDVVAAAMVALVKTNPGIDAQLLEPQLERSSWNDKIRTATLEAIGELDRPSLFPKVVSFAEAGWNQDVCQAAATAWKKLNPTDPRLHTVLMEMALSPSYNVQKFAIENLGELFITAALPWLEELQAADIAANLTVLAKKAIEEIRRVAPAASEVE